MAEFKRSDRCRVCGRGDRRIELAHVIGREHDLKDVEVRDGFRVALVRPDRVVPLCGPAIDTGSCHWAYDAYRLDLWDYLTEREKELAIEDAGGLGRALRRCAPLTWEDRVEIVDGEQVELSV